jgi:aspartyl-tRNA(Asn)/glutamyl-tRNA(Gln) amidotransferase subunit B
MEECPLKPGELVTMLGLIDKGVISGKIAKTVFAEMYKTGRNAETIVRERGLLQISDEGEIEAVVDDVLQKNSEAVMRFRSGEAKLMGFFVGQVMKVTRGKANPAVVNDLLKRKLS